MSDWLARAVSATILLYGLAVAAGLGLAWRARFGARISRRMVTGRALIALGDSGAFAMHDPPLGIHPKLHLADAESAAVAIAYWVGPKHEIVRGSQVVERPTERRHVCGRAYYVRPVLDVPDSIAPAGVDVALSFGPAWVIPVCNDGEIVRATSIVADAPTELRVTLGDHPGDVPELEFPANRWEPAHFGFWLAEQFPNWERGVGLAPETAVAVATTTLASSGARVTEMPEAFAIVPTLHDLPQDSLFQSQIQPQEIARWRLTLDRTLTLRGLSSGQVVRTRTVYVAPTFGVHGPVMTMQIARPAQPRAIRFDYVVRFGQGLHQVMIPVLEPIWFESARLVMR